MFLSAEMNDDIRRALSAATGKRSTLSVKKSVSGGSISQAYQAESEEGLYFLKVNKATNFPGMFLAEAEGLKRIRKTNTLHVPAVIICGTTGTEQYILMHWIEEGKDTGYLQACLGNKLAAMHMQTAPEYGFDHSNYMGSLPQSNSWRSNWTDFFISERLEPQLALASGRGLMDKSLQREFEHLFGRLHQLFPEERPALVHGDLWRGNYIPGLDQPFVIDPACYYAHREVDLAMTLLFGGFKPDFYAAYSESFPLEPGWEERAELWNLYPLLIHLNLFGAGYLPQIRASIENFA